MQRNIFGYTANTNPYPEYMSLNERDGKIVLTVREPAKPGQYSDKDSGATVEIELPPEQFDSLVTALEIERTNRKVYGGT